MPNFLIAVLLFCGVITPAAAQNPFTAPGQPVVLGAGYTLPSKILGHDRRINVLLPDGYDDPKQATTRYPVLYLLDGGACWQDFAHIAAMVHQGGLWGANAPMIVVGIESRDRRAEFTQPSSDAKERADFPTHGKADDFRRFLVEELKPAVAAAYRTSGTDGLIGESLAALFVVDVALRQPSAFDRYIAISPSLWWDGGSLSKSAASLLAARPAIPRTLWLSIADEGGAMQAGVDRIVAALRTSNAREVDWTYTPFAAERHATVYHPAATRAIRAVFPAPKP